MLYSLQKTAEFEEWFTEQPLKTRLQIEARLFNIVAEGHFGIHKYLAADVWELKWANGRRVYYAYLAEYNLLLLLGGNKNGQSKDITQAKKLFKKYTEVTP